MQFYATQLLWKYRPRFRGHVSRGEWRASHQAKERKLDLRREVRRIRRGTELTMAESEHRVWEYVAVQKSNPEQLAAALDKLDGEGYREIVSVSLGGPSTACSAILKRPATRAAVAAVR